MESLLYNLQKITYNPCPYQHHPVVPYPYNTTTAYETTIYTGLGNVLGCHALLVKSVAGLNANTFNHKGHKVIQHKVHKEFVFFVCFVPALVHFVFKCINSTLSEPWFSWLKDEQPDNTATTCILPSFWASPFWLAGTPTKRKFGWRGRQSGGNNYTPLLKSFHVNIIGSAFTVMENRLIIYICG